MNFTSELFQTRKDMRNTDTKFHHAYFGAFYDVYSDDDVEFHLPKECEKSLKARADFYRNYISKNPYPVIVDGYDTLPESFDGEKVMEQVLGLPDVCFYSKGTRLGLDEILSSLVYDEDILVQVALPSKTDVSLLESDDYSVICAMNDLVANGFYFPDMAFLAHPLYSSASGFPCYLDEKKIPGKYLKEPETSEKLLMDFVMNPLLVKADDFVRYFKPLDQMSLEEKFNLAFKSDDEKSPMAEQLRNEALRLYFASLMKQIVDDFYRHRFHTFFLCGFSPLDHDFGYYSFSYPYRAMGESFEMQAIDYFRPYKDPDTGEYDADIVLDRWAIHSSDRLELKRRFEFTKKFFAQWDNNHDDKYLFMPALFLRAMGLPYQSYPYARFFDFASGDFDSFYALFEKVDSPSIQDARLRPLCLYRTREQENRFDKEDEEKAGVFVFPDFYRVGDTLEDILYFGDFSHTRGLLKKAISGDASVLNDYLGDMFHPSIYALSFSPLGLDYDQDYVRQKKDGQVYVLFRDFFRNLNDGMDSIRALKEADPNAPLSLAFYFLAVVSAIVENMKENTKKINKDVIRRLVDDDFSFYVPEAEYPYVFVGRNFLGYSKNKDGKDMVFSKDTKSGVKAILQYVKPSGFFFQVDDQGNSVTVAKKIKADSVEDMAWFLGLPKRVNDSLSSNFVKNGKLVYRSDVSIASKKYRKLFWRLPLLLLSLSEECKFVSALEESKISLMDFSSEEYEKVEEFVNSFEEDYVEKCQVKEDIYTEENENLALLTPHGKAWMHEKGLLDNDDYSLMNVFYDEKLKMDVAVGRNFYAYGHRSDFNSFKLSQVDYPAFMQMFYRFGYQALTCKNKDLDKTALLVYALGLPPVFVYKLQFGKEHPVLSMEDIKELLGFERTYESDMNPESFSISYLSCYRHGKIPLGSARDSTQLRILARYEGLYLSGGISVLDSNMFDPVNLARQLKDADKKLDLFSAVIEPYFVHDAVLMLLFPSYTTLNIEMDDFISEFEESQYVTRDELYEFREFMNLSYEELSTKTFLEFITDLFPTEDSSSSSVDQQISKIKEKRGLTIDTKRLKGLVCIFVVFCIRKTLYWISQNM